MRYGAKALPEGGWNTIPRPYMDGGAHRRRRGRLPELDAPEGHPPRDATGMLAAETAFEAVRAGDTSAARLAAYSDRIDASAGARRAVSGAQRAPGVRVRARCRASLFAGAGAASPAGAGSDDLHGHAGHERMRTLDDVLRRPRGPLDASERACKPDRVLTFDKLTNVHYSGTAHDEDQPSHLLVHTEVCNSRLRRRSTATRARGSARPTSTRSCARPAAPRLQINASNCVHCKTCDIMDPYQVITWVPPEGGGGPQYDGM